MFHLKSSLCNQTSAGSQTLFPDVLTVWTSSPCMRLSFGSLVFFLKSVISSLVFVTLRSKAGETELRSEAQRRDFKAENFPEAASSRWFCIIYCWAEWLQTHLLFRWLLVHLQLGLLDPILLHVLEHQVCLLYDADWTPHGRRSMAGDYLYMSLWWLQLKNPEYNTQMSTHCPSSICLQPEICREPCKSW